MDQKSVNKHYRINTVVIVFSNFVANEIITFDDKNKKNVSLLKLYW